VLDHPDVDHNEYRYFDLKNKLKVLLIHDPSVQLSESSMTVHKGSWDEPNEFPGLAHFLEHMLF
jgi:insulysin